MLRKVSFLICIAILFSCKSPGIPEEVSLYYPEPGVWEKRDAAFMGFDAIKLEEAISFGLENQTQGSKDLGSMLRSRARTVHDSLVGPRKSGENSMFWLSKMDTSSMSWGILKEWI